MGSSSLKRTLVHLAVALTGVLVFQLVSMATGGVEDSQGLGWDGEVYAAMVTGRLADARPYPQSRPLPVLVARIPHRLGLDVVASFKALNYLYAFLLYLTASLLLERHGADPRARTVTVVNLAMCIATARMFAFYPVQVDLAALTVTMFAFYAAGGDRPWLAAVACVLAVSSREFGAAAVLYGVHAAVRKGRPWLETAVVYLPSVVTIGLIRWWVAASHAGESVPGIRPYNDALGNLNMLWSPSFLIAFAYFAIIVFGGISALLLVRARWSLARLFAQPELATFLVVIVGLTALGNIDIWRYLVFSLPVALVLVAQHWRECDSRAARRLAVVMTLFTLITQRPFERMDSALYFRDWFPLYHLFGNLPPVADLIPVWSVRLTAVTLLMVGLYLIVRRDLVPPVNRTDARPLSP